MLSSEDDVLRAAGELRWQQPDRAIEVLREFLVVNPKSVRARLRLASIYADEYGEDVAGAERLYREVLADDPDNVPALSGLALLQGYPEVSISTDERLRLLSKAADISGDPWAILNLANKAWDLGRREEALEAFTRLLSVAESRGEKHLATMAEEAIHAIRRGEASTAPQYSWPEI
jgi:tetratricopeptide (TPR) repeat protein